MNKTLLLILCDFLLLNLLALTRWEKAEPANAKQPPVPELSANAATKDRDLVEAMKQSLDDERATREQLAQKLSSAESNLTTREQNLAKLEADRAKLETDRAQLASTLTETQRTAEDLSSKVAEATRAASMTREELARLQRELEERRAEAERQKQALSNYEKSQAEARQKIEGLSVAVKVAEQEKLMLRETAETLKTQVVAERQERLKVQEATTQLAQGVGQLAEKSGALTKEIRDNRPINANVLFSEFLANRVTTNFTAVRPGLFGAATRESTAGTILVTDGSKTYALLHISDTPFPLTEYSNDWEKITVEFAKPPYRSNASEIDFLSVDPRVVVVPVSDEQAAALGVKVYPTAIDPFRFPEAVLVNGGGRGYGEVSFKLDASQPGYVRVDNRLFKRLFGDFAPSRGDLVLSKTGEILGIMVNSDYCAVVNNFLTARKLPTGDNLGSQQTSAVLNELNARVRSLPLKLQ
jgi:chemotaxis protein histidine kinase CheA